MEDFAEFVQGSGTRLLRVAFLLTGDRQEAEDLVQTVLARLSMRWQRVATLDDPVAYARKSLVNSWRNARRRRWRGERPYASVPDHAASDEVARYDVYHDLMNALRALPPRQRAAVVLRHYEDLSERDTAAALGCSISAVKTAASRGLATLRTLVDDGGDTSRAAAPTKTPAGEGHALRRH